MITAEKPAIRRKARNDGEARCAQDGLSAKRHGRAVHQPTIRRPNPGSPAVPAPERAERFTVASPDRTG